MREDKKDTIFLLWKALVSPDFEMWKPECEHEKHSKIWADIEKKHLMWSRGWSRLAVEERPARLQCLNLEKTEER